MQLQSLNESSNRARERRILLERQLADAQTFVVPAAEATPGSPDATSPLNAAQQLEAARARLAVLEQRYTPDHPDVRSTKRLIIDLEKKAADEASRGPADSSRPAATPEELSRQRRIRDLQAQIDVIDHQITANDAEVLRLKATIAKYQADIDALPSRESELVDLTRDYSTLQATYTSLLSKREDSKLAANLERRQIGEQWKILDPASLPQKPYNQSKRLALIFSGAGAGLALGLCLVGLLEYRDSSLKRESDVVRIVGIPVLALIPMMESEEIARRRGRRSTLLGTTTIVLVLGSAVAMLFLRGPA
jgi:uncharacterized protein involved in exopolysaccharide biosynthesis